MKEHAAPVGAVSAVATPRPLRAAIVGSGMIARVHRRATLIAGGIVDGVLSSSADSTATAAGEWGVTGYQSFDQLLASDVDVVHVCTPNSTHARYAIAALDAGKHVICEKPIGLDVAEAEAMLAAAERNDRVATVPFVYRYHPIVRELRARRIDGAFGNLLLVHGSYLQDWMLSPDLGGWRVDPALGGASRAFADIGSHWCDLVEWVTGEQFDELTATRSITYPYRPAADTHAFGQGASAGSEMREVHTEDAAVAVLRTRTGLLANVTVSQVAAGRKNRLWFELDGATGSAVFDQENPESAWLGGERESRIVVRDPGVGAADARRLSSFPAGHPQGYAQCFENFVDDTYAAIRGEVRDGLPTFADGVRTARIIDAFLTSAGTAAWTPIAPRKDLP